MYCSNIIQVSWKKFKVLYHKIIRTMYTKFHQTQRGFVEDMTKTFWCFFSVHSVYAGYTLLHHPSINFMRDT